MHADVHHGLLLAVAVGLVGWPCAGPCWWQAPLLPGVVTVVLVVVLVACWGLTLGALMHMMLRSQRPKAAKGSATSLT